jgi:hypothetical protein
LERSALANISQSNDDRAQMKWANNLWGKTCPDLKKGMALKGRIINGREVNFLVGEVSDYFDSLSMGGYLDSKVGHKARENFMMTPLFSPLTYYMGLDRKKVVQDLKAEVSGVVDVESHLLVDKTRIHPYRVFEEAKLVLVHPFSIAKEGNRILERKMSGPPRPPVRNRIVGASTSRRKSYRSKMIPWDSFPKIGRLNAQWAITKKPANKPAPSAKLR